MPKGFLHVNCTSKPGPQRLLGRHIVPSSPNILSDLMGQFHKIFCFWFFSWISFPPAPEYPIRTVSNIEKSQRYWQIKVHHRYQRHQRQICHQYRRHRRQILPPVLLVLLIPVANLPPVSTILAANCHRCQRRRWLLKMNLKEKIYLHAITLLPKGVQKKKWKFSDFFHLPPVSTTRVVHLELRKSPWIFEKIRNGPNGVIRGLGETDPWRKPEVKNLVALSL